MSNRWLETMAVVLAIIVLFFAGCEQSLVNDQSSETVKANIDKVSVPSGFIAEAFEATGGQDTWTKSNKLGFDCVVTFYEPDGSFYLTEQHYDIFPWSHAIEISGREPKGEYTWRFSNDKITLLQSAGQIDKFHPNLERSCFAQAVLAIATAPITLLESSLQFNRQDAAVKKEGQWYYPIHQTGENSGQAVFYQNRDTLRINMIRVPCSGTNESLVVRGYDYQEIDKNGPVVPSRIEVFSTDATGVTQKRLVKIDCHTVVQAK